MTSRFRSLRSGPAHWIVGLLCLLALTPPAVDSVVWGQQPDEAVEEEMPEAEPAPAPRAKKTSAAPKESESTGGRKQPYFIWWVIKTSGWIGAVILALSMYFIATVGRLFVELRPEVAMPPDLIESCKAMLEKRDYKGMYAALKEDDCFFSRVVSAGMAELSIGLPEARDAMERVGEVQTVDMERKISMLAVLGTLGPMIGLLGTLQGMIGSFSIIAMSDTQMKAGDVAQGISEALLLTFEGVALSVPAIYFFAIFRNRVSSISAATLLSADEFVRRLANAARTKPTTVAPPPPPPGSAAARPVG